MPSIPSLLPQEPVQIELRKLASFLLTLLLLEQALFVCEAWKQLVALTANVLNVPMSVCAPEKSIVPWACATVANVSAMRNGAKERAACRSVS
jgi:hypothetical protein